MAISRVYADTSVFGGVFDVEFATPSQAFFRQVRNGSFVLVSSAVVRGELDGAPEEVSQLFQEMAAFAEIAEITEAAIDLRQAYLAAGIVGPKCADDALHVALATVSACELIISWNFRHIVHHRKRRQYNAVNILQGFTAIAIHSPSEVIEYGNQEL